MKLFELKTVEYHVSVEADYSACFVSGETKWSPIDPDIQFEDLSQQKELPSDLWSQRIVPWASSSHDLPVYGCLGDRKHVEERGVYNLRSESFQAESKSTGQAIFPVNPEDRDHYQSERIWVDETLYARAASGIWRKIPTNYVWRPFVFESGSRGDVPIGDIGHMMASYEEIEIIGAGPMDGVEAVHYRGQRENPMGVETIDAWIGADDGLPRRVEIVMVSGDHDEGWQPTMPWSGLETIPKSEWLGVGVTPPTASRSPLRPGQVLYTYTYEFSDFNEPVSIVAPIP
jgi:hypothetical protein